MRVGICTNLFIWQTVSSSGAWDNEMLRQRNILEVIYYFVQKDTLGPNRRVTNVCQPHLLCMCVTLHLCVLHEARANIDQSKFVRDLTRFNKIAIQGIPQMAVD